MVQRNENELLTSGWEKKNQVRNAAKQALSQADRMHQV